MQRHVLVRDAVDVCDLQHCEGREVHRQLGGIHAEPAQVQAEQAGWQRVGRLVERHDARQAAARDCRARHAWRHAGRRHDRAAETALPRRQDGAPRPYEDGAADTALPQDGAKRQT